MRLQTRNLSCVAMIVLLIACSGPATAQRAPGGPGPSEFDAFYSLGPDSLPRDGVPKGEVRGPFKLASKAYPGVEHSYWVYVPAAYDASREVSLMVFNDGATYLKADGNYRAQNVLDNLIYRADIPVMIGAFIDPGVKVADGSSIRQDEYDTVSDQYSKVIVDELLPALYKDYKISRDPERHGFAGWSSGAIAAFTVAWERPDQFHKVLTGIGTFVDLKGGYVYPEKVLASEKKPIRIFMIDGRNDNRGTNAQGGAYDPNRDWFLQNVRLMQALTKKGYDVNYSWGMGVHSHSMGGAMLPEMMRWLWRDQPVSVDPLDKVERSFRGSKSQTRGK
ncbi:MAG TPA: alpha/beta hydrolase-fold protein [Terriglobia bacterium]|nr:alpha/beta hydrolase-fold protein [Terriglobia bacterium]